MTTILAIAGAVVALGGAALVIAKAFRVWWKISGFIDRLIGVPAQFGLPAQPGLLERLEDHDELIKSMHHEMHPNGGSSMRDVVDRTEKALADHIAACPPNGGAPVQVTVNQPQQGAPHAP